VWGTAQKKLVLAFFPLRDWKSKEASWRWGRALPVAKSLCSGEKGILLASSKRMIELDDRNRYTPERLGEEEV